MNELTSSWTPEMSQELHGGYPTIKPGSVVMPKRHPECWIASVLRIEANKALLDIEDSWLHETEDGKGLWRKLTPPIRAWVPIERLELSET